MSSTKPLLRMFVTFFLCSMSIASLKVVPRVAWPRSSLLMFPLMLSSSLILLYRNFSAHWCMLGLTWLVSVT